MLEDYDNDLYREKITIQACDPLGKSSAHWNYKLDDETVAQFDGPNEVKRRWGFDERYRGMETPSKLSIHRWPTIW